MKRSYPFQVQRSTTTKPQSSKQLMWWNTLKADVLNLCSMYPPGFLVAKWNHVWERNQLKQQTECLKQIWLFFYAFSSTMNLKHMIKRDSVAIILDLHPFGRLTQSSPYNLFLWCSKMSRTSTDWSSLGSQQTQSSCLSCQSCRNKCKY